MYKDKGSKFIAFAYPVANEEDVKEHLNEIKTRYHDARHHCYAYKIGLSRVSERMNDDGEPPGTAGKPIHGQILSASLTNILIIVVRYFGGTLLGTGGLIQAYKSAAAAAIKQAGIVKETLHDKIDLEFGYPVINQVMQIIKEEQLEDAEYDLREDCKISIQSDPRKTGKLLQRFGLIDNLKVQITKPQL
jgi:uncharacterized YigZ family protein